MFRFTLSALIHIISRSSRRLSQCEKTPKNTQLPTTNQWADSSSHWLVNTEVFSSCGPRNSLLAGGDQNRANGDIGSTFLDLSNPLLFPALGLVHTLHCCDAGVVTWPCPDWRSLLERWERPGGERGGPPERCGLQPNIGAKDLERPSATGRRQVPQHNGLNYTNVLHVWRLIQMGMIKS